MEEAFEEGRLAHAALARDQAELAALDQVFEPGEPLVHARILPQVGHGGMFREGLALELEVIQIHQSFLS